MVQGLSSSLRDAARTAPVSGGATAERVQLDVRRVDPPLLGRTLLERDVRLVRLPRGVLLAELLQRSSEAVVRIRVRRAQLDVVLVGVDGLGQAPAHAEGERQLVPGERVVGAQVNGRAEDVDGLAVAPDLE